MCYYFSHPIPFEKGLAVAVLGVHPRHCCVIQNTGCRVMALIPESDISVLINQLALAQNCQSLLPTNESELGLVFTWRTHNVKQMPNQHFLLNVTTTQPHTNMLHVSPAIRKCLCCPRNGSSLHACVSLQGQQEEDKVRSIRVLPLGCIPPALL